jgi:hypothetical protein
MPHLQDAQTRLRIAKSALNRHIASGAKVPEPKPEAAPAAEAKPAKN